MPGDVWSDQKKVQAVTTWLALGSIPLVEGITGVPRTTIRQWKLQPWWKELIEEIQTEETQELDAKLKKVVDKTLALIEDRLDNGDLILNSKTGNVVRIPVKLRDVHQVGKDLLEQRHHLKHDQVIRVAESTIEDTLRKLAESFTSFVKQRKGETIDAVYAKRPAGLQEGSETLYLEAGSSEAQGGAEQSPQINGTEGGTSNTLGRGPQGSSV
jgi:hypothetical protein